MCWHLNDQCWHLNDMCWHVLLAINFMACIWHSLNTLLPLKFVIGFLHSMVGGRVLSSSMVGIFSPRNTLALAIALTSVLDNISTSMHFNPRYCCYAPHQILCQKIDNYWRS